MTSFSSPAVICAALPGRGSGHHHTRAAGYTNINVSSAQPHTRLWRKLSPFLLGPISKEDTGMDFPATCLENLWQSYKVFPDDVEADGTPNAAWYTRCKQICSDRKPHRRIPGKKGIKPLYSYYKDQRLDYDQARRQIYIPLYMKYVRETHAYQQLEARVAAGEQLQLLEPDGRPFQDLKTELQDVSKLFGHGLVLCTMLLKQEDDVLS